MNVFGIEMNGGARKTLIASAVTLGTASVGYLVATVAKVEPLAVKTGAIGEKLDMHIWANENYHDDQKEWNKLFMQNQDNVETKIDAVLKAVREKP